MTKTLGECKTESVIEHYDAKIKYKPLYALFFLFNFLTPYITGPLIWMNEKRFTKLGWLPYYTETTQVKV